MSLHVIREVWSAEDSSNKDNLDNTQNKMMWQAGTEYLTDDVSELNDAKDMIINF